MKSGLDLYEKNRLRLYSAEAIANFKQLNLEIDPLRLQEHVEMNALINGLILNSVPHISYFEDNWKAAKRKILDFTASKCVFVADSQRWENPSFRIDKSQFEYLVNELPYRFFLDGFFVFDDVKSTLLYIDYSFEFHSLTNEPIEIEIEIWDYVVNEVMGVTLGEF